MSNKVCPEEMLDVPPFIWQLASSLFMLVNKGAKKPFELR